MFTALLGLDQLIPAGNSISPQAPSNAFERVQAAAEFIRSVVKCLDFEMYQLENRHPGLAFDK